MSESEKFSNLVDSGAFLALERQLRLEEAVEGHTRWDADLAAGTITFAFADRPAMVCEAQLLGSSALNPGSWLWGWANGSVPEKVTAVARGLRTFGEEHGIPELTQPELPLTEEGNDGIDALWYRITIAAAGLVPDWHASFRAPTGEGSVAPFLLRHPDLELPAADFPRVPRVLTQGLSSVRLGDHRAAVDAYARARGIPVAATAAGLELALPAGALAVELDDQARITRLGGSMGPRPA